MTLFERLAHYPELVPKDTEPKAEGRLTRMVGLTLEAVGLNVMVGDRCLIEDRVNSLEAEVVGFQDDRVFLMPVQPTSGLRAGARVRPLGSATHLVLGDELLGRVVNAFGLPLDGKAPIHARMLASLQGEYINPLHRQPIRQHLDVGIRAINAMLSVGRGQRLGLFAGSGVGKSVLLGMMTRFTKADVCVVGLIGERGREVKEFIEDILGEEGLARSVVVASPADDAPLMRLRAAQYCTSIAEYFRSQGKNVLLLMDSLTRYAQAQREIALAIGEPPATKGYPPSVFARLPQLVERAGNGAEGGGSITAFYTVLTEGDDQQDPVADSARAILDGHVVLSRALAEQGHYPAIDIEASISRAMPQIVSPEHLAQAQSVKQMWAKYRQSQDLISIGAYQPGSDVQLDQAILLYPRVQQFLRQGLKESLSFEQCQQALMALSGGNAQAPAPSQPGRPAAVAPGRAAATAARSPLARQQAGKS